MVVVVMHQTFIAKSLGFGQTTVVLHPTINVMLEKEIVILTLIVRET